MTGLGVLTTFAAVGSGLVGGVFFAFSGFVMPALQRLPAGTGVAVMQAINRAAVGAPLMTALFGTAVAAVAVPLLAWRSDGDWASLTLLCFASGCYLLGTVGVTMTANVPLNDQLAATPVGTATADTWTRWVAAWSHRNLIRTGAALAAAVLYSVALGQPRS